MGKPIIDDEWWTLLEPLLPSLATDRRQRRQSFARPDLDERERRRRRTTAAADRPDSTGSMRGSIRLRTGSSSAVGSFRLRHEIT